MCNNCNDSCLNGITSSECIKWEGECFEEASTFNSLIEYLYSEVKEFSEVAIDIKSLSASSTLSRDEIIQILVDEIIRLKRSANSASSSSCSSLDLSPLGGCTGCNTSICSTLEFLIAKIVSLESQVEALNAIIND